MSERRIVQIAAARSLDSRGYMASALYAVSDDGKAFAWDYEKGAWKMLPALPASQDAKGGA